jgi:hypothetical protein
MMVAVLALRNAGAVIQMKSGDLLKTTERNVEAYEAAGQTRFPPDQSNQPYTAAHILQHPSGTMCNHWQSLSGTGTLLNCC